jgi:Ca-activated chloride channel family protein
VIAKSVISKKGSRGLARISEETGGRGFGYEDDENARAFARIEEELRSLYVLGFTVPEEARDGKFHKLEVKSARGGVQLRTRPGYTAPR